MTNSHFPSSAESAQAASILALYAAREYIGEDNNPRSNRVLQRIKNALDGLAGCGVAPDTGSQSDLLRLAAEFEAGTIKAATSGYEEFGPDWQRERGLIVSALRFTAHTFNDAQAAQEPNEAEIEAWIRILDTEQSRNLVMWRDRALRAERELSEANGKMFAALTAQPPADPVETEEGNYDRSNSEAVAWIAFAGNGNIRLWTADEGRAKDEKAGGLDMRAFTLAELVALVSRIPVEPQPSAASVRDALEPFAKLADLFDLYEPKSKTDSVMVNIRLEDLRKARRVLANEPQTLGTTNEGATDV